MPPLWDLLWKHYNHEHKMKQLTTVLTETLDSDIKLKLLNKGNLSLKLRDINCGVYSRCPPSQDIAQVP
jgi:hypothetical protein